MIADEVLIRRSVVVAIHLDTLGTLLETENPGASEAIRASLSLRFLFDGALNQVAHENGIRLTISAPTLDGVPLDQAMAAACGGYRLGNRDVAPYYLYREPGLNSAYRPQFEEQVKASPKSHVSSDVSLGRFQQLPCLAILGRVFTREETMRYVANKCGGAHHDDETKSFNEIQHGLTSVGHGLALNGDGVSAVFLETLGTAWFLVNAPDIVDLRARLSS